MKELRVEYLSELGMSKKDEYRIVKLEWIGHIASPNLDIHSSRLTSHPSLVFLSLLNYFFCNYFSCTLCDLIYFVTNTKQK